MRPQVLDPELDFDLEPPRRRNLPVTIAVVLVLASALGGGAVAFYRFGGLKSLPFLSGEEQSVPVVRAPQTGSKEAPPSGVEKAVASAAPANLAQEIDAGFQRAPLWKLVKREFPAWYAQRVDETAKLRIDKKDDRAIAAHLTQSLIQLRRSNAESALAASPQRLRFIASAFVENLASLAKHSTDACYGFISQGEGSPLIIELMRASPQTASLQAQFAAILEAVVEGRKAPQKHAQPQREDYDILAQQLAQKGWGPADLQTFSDARALARAKPERVCQMVQDWFSAQLAVKDEAVQLRLLVEALKPVIAG